MPGYGLSGGGGNGWLRVLTIDPKQNLNNVLSDAVNVLSETDRAEVFGVDDNNRSEPHFFCKETEGNHYYSTAPSDHNYTFSIDFSKPIRYVNASPTEEFEYIDCSTEQACTAHKNQIDNIKRTVFGTRIINDVSVNDIKRESPKIAANRITGAFVTVWEDDSDKSDDPNDQKGYDWTAYDWPTSDAKIFHHDIMMRLFCPTGCVDSKELVVNTSTQGQQRHPDVAMDKDGNFVVVWEDDKADTGYSEINMRGFDVTGRERFAVQTVNTTSAGLQIAPAIAMASDGQFIVVWQSKETKESDRKIYARRFKNDGTAIDENDILIQDSVSGNKYHALDVAMMDSGEFFVTWENNKHIYANHYDRNLESKSNVLHIGAGSYPAVAVNLKGQFSIVFKDDNTIKVNVDRKSYDVASNNIYDGSIPTICMDENDRAVVGVNGKPDDKKQSSVYLYKLDLSPDHVSYSKHMEVKDNFVGTQSDADISCTADGRHVITFLNHDTSYGRNLYNIMGGGFKILKD